MTNATTRGEKTRAAGTQYVRLWMDHRKFGCGWREFAVVAGSKWVKLTAVGSGRSATISRAQYDAAARNAKPIEGRGRNPKRQLRRNAKIFGTDKTRAVQDALARA